MGKRHRGQQEEPAPKRLALSVKGTEGVSAVTHRCESCSLSFNSDVQWQGHLKGKKHRNRVSSATRSEVEDQREASPSSDEEDYESLRKKAPRIKKKKRTSQRDRQLANEEKIKSAAVASAVIPKPASDIVLRQLCPYLSSFCLLQHRCPVDRSAGVQCTQCQVDLRDEKLHVSLSNSKIQQVSFYAKDKFAGHTDKCVAFIQLFVLVMDLRIASCLLDRKSVV